MGCRPTSFLPLRLKGLKRGPAELLPLLSGGGDAAAAEMTRRGFKRRLHLLESCLPGSRRTWLLVLLLLTVSWGLRHRGMAKAIRGRSLWLAVSNDVVLDSDRQTACMCKTHLLQQYHLCVAKPSSHKQSD